MLEEWIRNVTSELLNRIVNDPKAQGSRIWNLAVVELMVRHSRNALAA